MKVKIPSVPPKQVIIVNKESIFFMIMLIQQDINSRKNKSYYIYDNNIGIK